MLLVIATITIIRYPKKFIYFALLSMAIFHLPLWFNKKISFYKLLGSGKNGSFDIHPDWQQWGILTATNNNFTNHYDSPGLLNHVLGKFIAKWIKLFKAETFIIFLQPIEGHGTWDGKHVFGELTKQPEQLGMIAVLTRATIRFSKLKPFWKNAENISKHVNQAEGLLASFGIGEIPFIKQATFSVWESKESMKQFAYHMQQHKSIMQKTRKEGWYSEDMFVRFKILHHSGTINGKNPLKIK